MPTASAVSHPKAPGVPRMVLSISDRLGPVMDNPHPQLATDPETHARGPTIPSASPVRGQGQVSYCAIGARPATPSAMSPISPAIVGQCGCHSTASMAGGNSERGVVSQSITERSGPWAAAVAPRDSPSAAAPAPRLPAPTRDHMDVAQPLPTTIPAPKTSPPMSAATGVTGGRVTTRKPTAAKPLTARSKKPRATR